MKHASPLKKKKVFQLDFERKLGLAGSYAICLSVVHLRPCLYKPV